jgi:NAD(P)-dependent dehydrogenase (short-subunit alcohol dehydrogenase family)
MTEQYDRSYLELMMVRVVAGRMGDARELAATLVWLASDAAGYVTGQTIVVDGGVTIT